MKPSLVIMAAGMGSRYGGLKQIDEIDDKGHIIIDFSIYDAIQAGFDKIVFVIKKQIEKEFKEKVGNRISEVAKVEYVYQELDELPGDFQVPEGRVKPWGTAQAVWCCRHVIHEPFAVVNSDDYYGRDAFNEIYKELSAYGDNENHYCMVGYVLKNTLTDNGYVSRGICGSEDGVHLSRITEKTRIIKKDGGVCYSDDDGESWKDINPETLVSMNLWGFDAGIMDRLEDTFIRFLQEEVPANPLKSECFLPTVVQQAIDKGEADCKILKSESKWFGVTYKEDKEQVVKAIAGLKAEGLYPEMLWVKRPVHKFQIKGEVLSCERYGNGHINDTFLVETENGAKNKRYILQRMNRTVFKDPDGLMTNISLVTDHIRKKLEAEGGDAERGTMVIIPTVEGKLFYEDTDGDYWRMYDFVEDTVSYEKAESPEIFRGCAYAFGQFQKMLSDFDASKLMETIPDFHNTPKRILTFEKAIEEDAFGRAGKVKEEIKFFLDRKEDMCHCQKLLEEGKIPLRVTHNDTKLNNILVDAKTGKGLCVIDLDTVMPGLAIYDFGDAIRFGANTGAEDEKDLSKISLSLELFDIYAKGFIQGCEGALSSEEILLLPMGAKNMTMECGMRFLTDYLQGDVYFKTAREDHNLDRARTQIALVLDMEKKWDEMQDIVKKYM